jgi:hypothetical protein
MFELPEDTPASIKALPREERGYPIPYFVAYNRDGSRDLRFADVQKQHICVRQRLCWVCGKSLNILLGFLGGPLSVVNRLHSDMACHPSCAEFSVKYCPHVNNASAKYRDSGKPFDANKPVGMVKEHPGVTAIVYCTDFETSPPDKHGGILASPLGVTRVDWWFEGGQVTQAEAADLWVPPKQMVEHAPEMVDAIRKAVREMEIA